MKKINKKILTLVSALSITVITGAIFAIPQLQHAPHPTSPAAESDSTIDTTFDHQETTTPHVASPAKKHPSTPTRTTVPVEDTTLSSSTKKAGGSVLATNNPTEVKNYAAANELTVTRESPQKDGLSLIALAEPIDNPDILALKQQPHVLQVSQNYTYRTTYTPTNPDTYYNDQWNLNKISAQPAWDITTGNSNTTIAVIDTGTLFAQTVNGTIYNQPDFPASKLWTNAGEQGLVGSEGLAPNCSSRGLALNKDCNNIDDDKNGQIDDWQGWDFMGGFNGNGAQCPNYQAGRAEDLYIAEDNDPQPYSCDSPVHYSALNKTHYDGGCSFGYSACYIGHGTMVASAATSASDNGQLVAGVDHLAKVMNLRVIDGYGYTTTAHVSDAVRYAAQNGADVINMSLAVNDCSENFVDSVLESAMADAKAAGVVIVAASGNEYLSTVCYPASSKHAIAVGASNRTDGRAAFSNYGSKLDVVAPGVDIPVANAPSSAIDSPYYPNANGTSLATPHVAGLAGLIKAVRPNASPDEIRRIITERADITPSMNGSPFTREFGHGRINSYTSVRVAEGLHRPIYELYNSTQGCRLLTSSIDERDLAVFKRGYTYQKINHWQLRDTGTSYEHTTTTHTCR